MHESPLAFINQRRIIINKEVLPRLETNITEIGWWINADIEAATYLCLGR